VGWELAPIGDRIGATTMVHSRAGAQAKACSGSRGQSAISSGQLEVDFSDGQVSDREVVA
jgi:hypothetical protein